MKLRELASATQAEKKSFESAQPLLVTPRQSTCRISDSKPAVNKMLAIVHPIANQQTLPITILLNVVNSFGFHRSATNNSAPKLKATATMQLASAVTCPQCALKKAKGARPVCAPPAANITALIAVSATKIKSVRHSHTGVSQWIRNGSILSNIAR